MFNDISQHKDKLATSMKARDIAVQFHKMSDAERAVVINKSKERRKKLNTLLSELRTHRENRLAK
jgi:hypothetical protein